MAVDDRVDIQVEPTVGAVTAAEALELRDARSIDPGFRALGSRFQALRRARDLSLKQVADDISFSTSFLSLVERGLTDLSVTRFCRLSEYYGVQPSELMVELGQWQAGPRIAHVSDGREIDRGIGVTYRVIRQDQPQLVHVELAPESEMDLRSHRGDDFWVVLEGSVQLAYGGGLFALESGQTADFSGTVPHGFVNPGSQDAKLLALCSVAYW